MERQPRHHDRKIHAKQSVAVGPAACTALEPTHQYGLWVRLGYIFILRVSLGGLIGRRRTSVCFVT